MRTGSFQAGMAEALGVFLLVFFGGSAICMNQYLSAGDQATYGLLGIALVHGFALMAAVYLAAGKSGGHINPAVTIGLLVLGKISSSRAFIYIVFQLVGAVLAGLAVWGMFSADYREGAPYLGTPTYDDMTMSSWKAIGVEAILTFTLMIVVLMTAVDSQRAAKQTFGLSIGMTVFACIMVAGPFTGASMNPARYFGTAAASGHLAQLPAYLWGPVAGALIAALIYKLFMESSETAAVE